MRKTARTTRALLDKRGPYQFVHETDLILSGKTAPPYRGTSAGRFARSMPRILKPYGSQPGISGEQTVATKMGDSMT
jgi:hypothetical protein